MTAQAGVRILVGDWFRGVYTVIRTGNILEIGCRCNCIRRESHELRRGLKPFLVVGAAWDERPMEAAPTSSLNLIVPYAGRFGRPEKNGHRC